MVACNFFLEPNLGDIEYHALVFVLVGSTRRWDVEDGV
jgi:hypothetical protein